jgi:hypothetical protein
MTALDVAMDLARRGITAGVILCDDGTWTTHTDPAGVRTVSARRCQVLNASLLQSRERGVLHIRTADEPPHVTAVLNRRIDIEAATDVRASEAVTHRIVRAVRGKPQAPEVPLGASGSCAASPVTLRGGSTTVIAALDDVARQVPGLVWQLTFASDDADRFMLGLLCGGTGGSASGLLEPLLP